MKRIDHFTYSALKLAEEQNISFEEAKKILIDNTLKLHNEFLNTNTNAIQIEEDNTSR